MAGELDETVFANRTARRRIGGGRQREQQTDGESRNTRHALLIGGVPRSSLPPKGDPRLRERYFGPSGTKRAGRPRASNHGTIATCGGFSIP